jgi:hypothetical protein
VGGTYLRVGFLQKCCEFMLLKAGQSLCCSRFPCLGHLCKLVHTGVAVFSPEAVDESIQLLHNLRRHLRNGNGQPTELQRRRKPSSTLVYSLDCLQAELPVGNTESRLLRWLAQLSRQKTFVPAAQKKKGRMEPGWKEVLALTMPAASWEAVPAAHGSGTRRPLAPLCTGIQAAGSSDDWTLRPAHPPQSGRSRVCPWR